MLVVWCSMGRKWILAGVGMLLLASIVLLLFELPRHSPGRSRQSYVEDAPPGRIIEPSPATEPAEAGHSLAQPPALATKPAPSPGEEQPGERTTLASSEALKPSKVRTLEELEEQVFAEREDLARRHKLVQQRINWLEFEEGPLRWFVERAEKNGSWTPEKVREKRQRLENVRASLRRMRAEFQRLDRVQ